MAVSQYPTSSVDIFSTRISRFADGSEQRFREFGQKAREWRIRLQNLTTDEVEAIRRFFDEHNGRLTGFTFIDPWDGTEHPGCRFTSDELAFRFNEECQAHVELVIRRRI